MSKRRVAAALVGLVSSLATMGSLVLAPQAQALPRQSVVIFYFSDADFSEVVGEKNISCSGYQDNWGIHTPYVVSMVEDCGYCDPFGGPCI